MGTVLDKLLGKCHKPACPTDVPFFAFSITMYYSIFLADKRSRLKNWYTKCLHTADMMEDQIFLTRGEKKRKE